MVSVLSRAVDAAKGLVATGRNRPSFDPVTSQSTPESADTRGSGALLGPQSPPGLSGGVGPAARTPGVLSGHFAAGTLAPEPHPAALRPQPLFSPQIVW